MKVELFAHPDCWKFKEEHPDEWENYGCGASKGLGDALVPDTMYGLSVRNACRIHDWYYGFWPYDTEEGRELADRVFRNNLLRIVRVKTANAILRFLRERRCITYYKAVRNFGAEHYFAGRNFKEEMQEVNCE